MNKDHLIELIASQPVEHVVVPLAAGATFTDHVGNTIAASTATVFALGICRVNGEHACGTLTLDGHDFTFEPNHVHA